MAGPRAGEEPWADPKPIFMVEYGGWREDWNGPDWQSYDIEPEHGYFPDRESAEAFCTIQNADNREDYAEYVQSRALMQDEADAGYAERVERWEKITAAGIKGEPMPQQKQIEVLDFEAWRHDRMRHQYRVREVKAHG